MESGKLNRRITIQKKTSVADSSGQMIPTPVTDFSVWAQIISSGGGEFYAAQKVHAETSIVFKVRYRTDITVLKQILFGTRTFQILAVNDVDGMKTELQISAKEVI